MYNLLQALIGSLGCLYHLLLARVITLISFGVTTLHQTSLVVFTSELVICSEIGSKWFLQLGDS